MTETALSAWTESFMAGYTETMLAHQISLMTETASAPSAALPVRGVGFKRLLAAPSVATLVRALGYVRAIQAASTTVGQRALSITVALAVATQHVILGRGFALMEHVAQAPNQVTMAGNENQAAAVQPNGFVVA